jgi:hypothetical protein
VSSSRSVLLAIALLAPGTVSAQQAQVFAGANDNPNTLINATFVSPTMTYGTQVPSGGTTTGTTTSIAFNQVRVLKSTAGCSLVAQTNNGSNNVSIYVLNAVGAITPVSGSPFLLSAGVQSLAWAPDGGALYVPLAVSGASQVVVMTISCTPGGAATVTNAGSVTLAGFDLLRDAEVIGSGTGSHLCVSGTNSNNVGCFAINGGTRMPNTTAVNSVTVTNVRGMRIAGNGCGVAGVGSATTVQGFSVAAGSITLTNTGVTTTNPRYGAINASGTLAAFGGFGTQFTVFTVDGSCNLTLVGSNDNGIATSLVEYVAFDGLDRLYVADSLANQIRVFAPTGAGIGAALSTSTTNHATVNAPGGIDAALLSTLPAELLRFGVD